MSPARAQPRALGSADSGLPLASRPQVTSLVREWGWPVGSLQVLGVGKAMEPKSVEDEF